MTEGRNPQMTRSTTDREAPADQGGWGATTNTAGSGAAAKAPAEGGIGAKLAGAATSAKGALRTAAAEAEDKSRPVRASKRSARQPRRARLTLSHFNVYSVFKFACVLSIALFLVWLIVVGVLYGVLDVAGALNKVNSTVREINGDNSKPVISGGVVFLAAMIIGVVNMVLFIILSTVGAMIYNLCADLVGGAEVTLSERE